MNQVGLVWVRRKAETTQQVPERAQELAENATTSEGRTTATTVANVSIETPGFSMAGPAPT